MSHLPEIEQRPFLRGRLMCAGENRTVKAAAPVVLAAIAIAARLAMFPYQSGDYVIFLQNWYQHIDTNGGFRALKDTGFSDYNVPYLYLLAILTYLPVPPLAGIKAISVVFDLLLALFAYRIVGLRHHKAAWQPILAGAAVLLLPTVATNSGWWGQADSSYTAFAVGGVYFFLRQRPWWACAFFGLALAFKLQTVFIFPLLLVLVLTRRLPWRALLAIPAVYLALDVPALLLGASPGPLLTIYARQAGNYQDLTLNAPSVYQFVTAGSNAGAIRTAGVLFTAAVVIALTTAIVLRRTGEGPLRIGWRRPELTPARIVLLATTSVILVPFLLPGMHERYFYLADVLSVIAAFHLPRLWYLPILVQVSSFLSYLQYLSTQGDMGQGDMGGEGGGKGFMSQEVSGPKGGFTDKSGIPAKGEPFPSDGAVLPAPPGGPGASGGGFEKTGGGAGLSSDYSSMELKACAVLMALALLAVLWATFRDFRKSGRTGRSSSSPRSERV